MNIEAKKFKVVSIQVAKLFKPLLVQGVKVLGGPVLRMRHGVHHCVERQHVCDARQMKDVGQVIGEGVHVADHIIIHIAKVAPNLNITGFFIYNSKLSFHSYLAWAGFQ